MVNAEKIGYENLNIDIDFRYIKPEVIDEVEILKASSLDVEIINVYDHERPNDHRQMLIDKKVEELENSPNGYDEFRKYSRVSKWVPLTKRAIALHSIYNPNDQFLGQGIDPDIYEKKIFDGKSATDILAEAKGDESSQRILNAYKSFITAKNDRGTNKAVGTRDFLTGVIDCRSVRTRAIVAMELAYDHIENDPSINNKNDLISASLACGAAGPVYNLVNQLSARGHDFSKVILVDSDPMALATAICLGRGQNLENKIDPKLKNLLLDPLTSFIEPNSVDIIDLLGLFEYLPTEYGLELLRKTKDIVKPGGLILFGNMLDKRPQQKFFSNVVKWPTLQQRRISDVIDMIKLSGFDLDNLKIRVPSEGVYGVYAIKVPNLVEESKVHFGSVVEELGLSALQEY